MADLKLYYFPTSFFSQKVLLTLFEKEAQFREQVIMIHAGEQNEPWYLKVTPKGTVPALEAQGKVFTDSEDIVTYLDKELDTGIKLIPDLSSKIGQEVDKWRRIFNDLNIAVITYGIVFHPELSQTGMKVSSAMKKGLQSAKEGMRKGSKTLQEKAEKYPEFREEFLAKVSLQTERLAKMENKEVVIQALNELDTLFDQIESTLAETRKEQGVTDSWLLGSRFTMADIFLTILMDRLNFLGLEERYFVTSKRPLANDYYQRVGNRKSVQQNRQKFKKAANLMFVRMLKKTIPAFVGVLGVVISVLYWRARSK
ncbi:ganglioside-induced differentiation-associated protein 1-like [Ylistrum balloti]|uniref:ganglioside-induced differentiation-associated protein 1-like n=1 Tax=Ylistrum balloti TaxID=509963 RepID=UPI00290591B2|nr:ganglioside-induced differentiation-associated protein 1-like [Ylistrum balloti]